jgi:CubicO group peptidase (beta-lactamase class C family)
LFFVGGKNHPVIPGSITKYTIPKNLIYNIDEIYADQRHEEINKKFNRLNKLGIFNGTILYAENDQIIYKGAHGWADFRNKDSLSTSSSFQLASVSKMFTAMAIMILQEDGKLNYDDTIGIYISEFPYPEITIRQLLTHRSGLSRYMSLADKYWDINTPINNEDVIDLFAKYTPAPYFKPDDGFHYCNTNYAVLGSIVERISGQSFDEFAKANIFDPLGMENSFVYNLNQDSVIPASIDAGVPGYKYGGRYARKMGNYYLNGVMGDKGIYSSIEDLYKFSKALDKGTLVRKSTLDEAFAPGSPSYWKRKDNYGFGWRIKEDRDSTIYHFGWWKGFRTYFIRDMKNHRTLIALTNTHKGLSSAVLWDIIENEGREEEILDIHKSLE